MRFFKKVIEGNALLERLVVITTNKMNIGENECSLQSIQSRNNEIIIKGSDNRFICPESSVLRQCGVSIAGNNNVISIDKQSSIYGDKKNVIHIDGEDNTISIGTDCQITKTNFFISGRNNKIEIGNNCSSIYLYIHLEGDGNHIRIGDHCSFHGRPSYLTTLFSDEGKTITIGEDSMIAHGIRIRNSDSHSIFDETGQRINESKDVHIGKHCWIGLDTIILKGAIIPDHCIVAARSVCTRELKEDHCIIAGSPADTIQKGISWDRELSKKNGGNCT